MIRFRRETEGRDMMRTDHPRDFKVTGTTSEKKHSV